MRPLGAHPVDLPAGRGPGLFLRRDPGLPDGASLQRTDAVARKGAGHIGSRRRGSTSSDRSRGLNFLTNAAQSNSAVEFGILKPWDERLASQHGFASIVADGPDEAVDGSQKPSSLSASIRPRFRASARPVVLNFEVEDLTGRGSFAALNEATQALIAEARKQPELESRCSCSRSFSTSNSGSSNTTSIRTKAKLLGLNACPTSSIPCRSILGSLYVNDFNLFGRTFRVTLQADKDSRAAATPISTRLYVRNGTGGSMVPL